MLSDDDLVFKIVLNLTDWQEGNRLTGSQTQYSKKNFVKESQKIY